MSLTSALDRLPPGQRAVLDAFSAEWTADCTYESVARRLGVHIGTIRRHLMAIRASNPEAYAYLRRCRDNQLRARRERSAKRRFWHTTRWFNKLRKRARRLGIDWRLMAGLPPQ